MSDAGPLEDALRRSIALTDRLHTAERECKRLAEENDRFRRLVARILIGSARWVQNLNALVIQEFPPGADEPADPGGAA